MEKQNLISANKNTKIFTYQNYSNNYNKNKSKKNNIKYFLRYIRIFILLNLFLFIKFYIYFINNNLIKYKEFINDCKNLKRYNKIKLQDSNYYYLSICIPAHNMEKYIEKSLLSIINQSFQNFEIIIVNDNSNDNTENILKILQYEDNRIRIINHYQNLGVYCSRIDAALNAKGEFILFLDPDDMILNPYLFEELFNYNLKYNLDMIEFLVYHQIEGKKTIMFPNSHEFNHYHEFRKNIIYQPELSNIIFYIPNTKNYTYVFCRTIWNKLIKKKILLKTINYIETIFHNKYLITADDTPINIINFNFANNYSNIKIPGYLYNIRKNSMSRVDNDKIHDLIVSYNYLLYFKIFYKYIKDFKKNLNFLFYDLKISNYYLLKIKDLNNTKYILLALDFFKEIIQNNISNEFIFYIKDLQNYFLKN